MGAGDGSGGGVCYYYAVGAGVGDGADYYAAGGGGGFVFVVDFHCWGEGLDFWLGFGDFGGEVGVWRDALLTRHMVGVLVRADKRF